MKKILFRKLLQDCFNFFLIALFFGGIVIWIFQAVNYLDIMIEDGRDAIIYIKFTLMIFPKIISKILPFIFLISFIYVISKYETNNELVIFWSYGINKIQIINFLFKFSILIAIIQVLINSILVPQAQDKARSFLRNSNVDLIENFIKPKKFNDTIKDLTIFTSGKNKSGSLTNIYIKKGKGFSNFEITYAQKGNFKNIGNKQIFELFNGATLSFVNNKITNFNFSKSSLVMNNLETNTITYKKTQEVSTPELIKCYINIYNLRENIDLSKTLGIENCRVENIDNILKEFHKRIIIPFYIPVLMLIVLMLVMSSKENKNYLKFRIIIFFTGLMVIIGSEMTLRLIDDNILTNLTIASIPFALISFFYLYFYFRLKLITK